MSEKVQNAVRVSASTQEHQPEVAVIIVCYNQAAYLLDAIQSVLGQTYRNFEVVLVDDGSTDDTAEVARCFPEVHYVYQPNRGLAAARNAGLKLIHGRYVVFLDADDRLLPNALEAGVSCFQDHSNSGFVFGRFRNLHGDGSTTLPEAHLGQFDKYHYRHFLQWNLVGMNATVMYSREALERVGGFNEELRACEDYDVYLRISRNREVNQHNTLIAEYRKHATNMSNDNIFMLRAALRVLRMQGKYVKDSGGRIALQGGVAAWRRYYVDQEIQGWDQKNGRQRARALLLLVRYYPSGIARYALKFANAQIRRRAEGEGIRLGDLRRLTPISRQFGWDRGEPVDRYYIESFLRDFAADIQGRVLEVGDDAYSRRFGGNRITRQDVLHVSKGHPGTTIIASLEDAPQIPSGQFDCVILTQTLHLIYDLRAALATLYRILKPEGVLLATVPGISQICHDRSYPETDSWRFTAYSARRLFEEYFPQNEVRIQSYGNVLTAAAFLYGLVSGELKRNELEHFDSDYPLIFGVRARKPKRST